MADVAAQAGIVRTTLYRHLPPRIPELVTFDPVTATEPD